MIHSNLWEVAVLAFLVERPMHPYEIKTLLKQRHKQEVLAVKPGSLYNAIGRLERTQLIEPVQVVREGKRPERTVYKLTAEGERTLDEWIRRLVAVPGDQPHDFVAALNFMVYLDQQVAKECLLQRLSTDRGQRSDYATFLRDYTARIGRINVIESEYSVAMLDGEIGWIEKILAEMDSGTLRWDLREFLGQAVPQHG